MKILFVDKNKSLVAKVKKAIKSLPKSIEIKALCDDIFHHDGVIVSASNPKFSMGGGLDFYIDKYYPREVAKIVKKKGNQRIGNVIFTITVDKELKATPELVKEAIEFVLRNIKDDETLLLSGLGTGIGGLDEEVFTKVLIDALTPKKMLWKFLREGMRSDNGDVTWKIGEWQKVKGKVILCQNGFHGSERIYQAFSYVAGEILAQVEVSGTHQKDDDKQVWSKMRVLRAWKWTKLDSVALAIFAAEQVIDIFEKEYPNDDRPRKAIEAAKAYLKKPSRAASDASYAARAASDASDAASYAARATSDASYAARAASDASDASDAASDAASAAARAASYAASAAARAASDAASAAASYAARAASYAARAKLIETISDWMDERQRTLREIKK